MQHKQPTGPVAPPWATYLTGIAQRLLRSLKQRAIEAPGLGVGANDEDVHVREVDG